MKVIDGEKYLTIGEVSKEIGRGVVTIKNWYEYKDEYGANLPEMFQHFDKKGTRYFKEKDIPKLIAFRDSISYGQLAEVSRRKWGERNPNKRSAQN